jgi:hypothetical protein
MHKFEEGTCSQGLLPRFIEEGAFILLSLLEKMKIWLYYMLNYHLVPYCMAESALQEK